MFPPRFLSLAQLSETPSAVLGVEPNEFQSGFVQRQRRCSYVDAQHVAKPGVLADALVHHLFVHAPSARITAPRTNGEIGVDELAPDADDLDALRGVSINEEIVGHKVT